MTRVVIDSATGCWFWQGRLDKQGYGQVFHLNGRSPMVHKVMYELYNGPVPDGLELDHLCQNPSCIYPKHLEPVTHSVNILRGRNPGGSGWKTHCPQGHLYDETNTYWSHTGRHSGWQRVCRACKREYMRRRRAKNAVVN